MVSRSVCRSVCLSVRLSVTVVSPAKTAEPIERVPYSLDVLISLNPQAIEPVAMLDRPLKSVTRGQCYARPTVTFPSVGCTAI